MKTRSILVGGWEFTKDDGIDEKIAEIANGKIVFMPDASRFPEKQIERAVGEYKKYNTEVLLLKENAEKIPQSVKVVYLGGGQPEKFMEYSQNHKNLLEDIKNKFLKGKVVLCGSSTGAMVQFKEMLAQDSRGRGNTNLMPALSFIKNNTIVVPHWNESNASLEWRDKLLKNHKDKLIITIDEYTSLFWGDDEARVFGLGTVNIIHNGLMKSYKNGEAILNLHLII